MLFGLSLYRLCNRTHADTYLPLMKCIIIVIIFIICNACIVCTQGCKTKSHSRNDFQIFSGGDQERLQKVKQSFSPPTQGGASWSSWILLRMLLVAAPELHSASTRTPGAFQSIELAFLPRPGGAFQEDYTNPMRCMCSPNSSLSKTALADAGSTVWPARKWLHRRTLWWPASERWRNILVVSTGRWPKLQQSCCEISPWAPAFAKRFPSSASTPPRDPLELASLQKIGSHIFTPAGVWVCPEMPYKPKFQFHRGNDETHEILGYPLQWTNHLAVCSMAEDTEGTTIAIESFCDACRKFMKAPAACWASADQRVWKDLI